MTSLKLPIPNRPRTVELLEPHRAGVAIVGGGMLGLTLALRLAQAGRRVALYEAAQEIGGLAAAWSFGDFTWDKHYHVTLLSDLRLRKLLGELDLEQELLWRETRTGFFSGGRLHSLSNTWDFLCFPPLSLLAKLRLAGTIWHTSRLSDLGPLEDELVETWLRRLSGRTTWERMWLPLLRSKLGDAYQRTSAAFIGATIARLYAARRNGLKREQFGYVPGGYARILARFGERLRELGVELRLGQRVSQIDSHSVGPNVTTADGDTQSFDRVVLTLPASQIAEVCPGLNAGEQSRLREMEYLGIVCPAVVLRHPLAGFYVTNLTDGDLPFTGVIEMSALVDRDQQFAGKTLVYLPKYVTADDPARHWTDQDLRAQFIPALRRVYPRVAESDVLEFRVSRVRNVFALPTLGYSRRVLSRDTSLPGVHIASSFQIVGGTLNVNETVGLAEQAASDLLSLPARAIPNVTA